MYKDKVNDVFINFAASFIMVILCICYFYFYALFLYKYLKTVNSFLPVNLITLLILITGIYLITKVATKSNKTVFQMVFGIISIIALELYILMIFGIFNIARIPKLIVHNQDFSTFNHVLRLFLEIVFCGASYSFQYQQYTNLNLSSPLAFDAEFIFINFYHPIIISFFVAYFYDLSKDHKNDNSNIETNSNINKKITDLQKENEVLKNLLKKPSRLLLPGFFRLTVL